MEFMLPEILDMPWAVWPWEVDVVLGDCYGKGLMAPHLSF